MDKKQKQTQTTQDDPNFRNNLPFASSKESEAVQIVITEPVSIIATEVSLKDKEPKVHIEHFLDINSLENVGYIIKARLMCGIHHFSRTQRWWCLN